MWETPTTRVWERLHKEGKLNAAQDKFWQTKPAEELYDLTSDRDEVNNLASSPAHAATLSELRKAHREHTLAVRDIGLLPEDDMHRRCGKRSPYEAGHDPKTYPIERVLTAAEFASSLKAGVSSELAKAIADPDSGVRYWGVMGVLMRGESEFKLAHKPVIQAMSDESPSVRIAAAEAAGTFGDAHELEQALGVLMKLADPDGSGIYAAAQALNAIDTLGKKAARLKERILALPTTSRTWPERVTPIIASLHASLGRNL